MYVGMIGTRSLEMLLKSFHENYSDLFKKTTRYLSPKAHQKMTTFYVKAFQHGQKSKSNFLTLMIGSNF